MFFPNRRNIGSSGPNSYIEFPCYISYPQSVHMEADTRLRQGAKILVSKSCQVVIKKYTVISTNCTIIPNKHTSTVGIPQILLGISAINDQRNNITIGEDVWVGSNVTIMGNANIGRGCIIGACSTVTKDIPPYAIVVGSPARIVGVKFSIKQILQHETILYSPEERLSYDYLEELFSKYYKDVKVFGVNTILTNEQIDWLHTCSKKRKFTEDHTYFEKLNNYMNAQK